MRTNTIMLQLYFTITITQSGADYTYCLYIWNTVLSLLILTLCKTLKLDATVLHGVLHHCHT